MTEELFLTGATGYVGSGLLRKWLDATDARVNLLARGRRGASANERIDAVLAELYPEGDPPSEGRLEVWEGDVAADRLGLNERAYDELAERTTHVVHCAAAARFDLDLDEARKTNVAGTANVLAFAGKCGNLKRVDYVGTAYVAGERTGVVREDELDAGQRHRNTYERSKFEAEKYVRSMMAELPITILRPSIVSCDSRTGRASDHNGFYRLLRAYNLGGLTALPGNPGSFLDLVPVDYVAEAAFSLSRNGDAAGRCFHLTAGVDNAATLAEVRELAGRYLGREPFAIIPPAAFERYVSQAGPTLSAGEREMLEEVRLYLPYLTCEMRFDNSQAVAATGLEAPPLASYFEKLAAYVKAHAAP